MGGNRYAGDLRAVFTDEPLSPDTPVYIYCTAHPDLRRPSMRVYRDGAYCFTCGTYLSRSKLVAWVESNDPGALTAAKLSSSTRGRARTRPQLRPEEVEILATLAHNGLTSSQHRYLKDRGLSDRTIETYQLGHYGSAYTLPVFNDVDEITTIRFRRDDALISEEDSTRLGTSKYWGLRGSNDVTVYPFPIPPSLPAIILTEGEFDALILRQEGLNAFSLTNGVNAWQKVGDFSTLLPKSVAILLCYDNDSAGQKAAEQMRAELDRQGYRVSVHRYEEDLPKDVTLIRQTDALAFRVIVEGLRQWSRAHAWITI